MLCVKCFFSTYSEVPFAATLFLDQFSSSLAVGVLFLPSVLVFFSGGQSTQIKYLSKSTDTYNKILLH